MSFQDLIISLESISCILSFFGSICVALTWAYPVENRRKHGRILLLWLSFSDCISSIVYFIQTINFNTTGNFCKAMALLGIFFPVASFIWTDFVAFYLYLVVVSRHNKIEWSTLLRIFHITAWTVSGLVILFVAVYNHEGKAETGDDDVIYANTGGWCWISSSDNTSQFIWELIGGKIIEWVSCLIVLPYFYVSVCLKLRNWDSAIVINTTTAGPLRPQQQQQQKQQAQLGYCIDNAEASDSRADRTISSEVKKDDEVSIEEGVTETVDRIVDNNQRTISVISEDNNHTGLGVSKSNNNNNINNINNSSSSYFDETSRGDRSKYACEDLSEPSENRGSSFIDHSESGLKLKSVSGVNKSQLGAKGNNNKGGGSDLLPVMFKATDGNNNSNNNNNGNTRNDSTTGQRKELFTQFYLKLLALPIVFLFIRTWGSVRVILAFAEYKHKGTLQFLAIMQAFFDPSQGFFNAILFVFLSPEDRANLLLSLAVLTNYASAYIPVCARLSVCFASSATVNKELKRVEKFNNSQTRGRGESSAAIGENPLNRSLSPSSSSFGGISFEDESGFECDPSNRISDFSFESRLDSVATNQDF